MLLFGFCMNSVCPVLCPFCMTNAIKFILSNRSVFVLFLEYSGDLNTGQIWNSNGKIGLSFENQTHKDLYSDESGK